MTTNPKWPEIYNACKDAKCHVNDRPDIVARVFYLKLKALMQDLQAGALGKTVAYMHVVEFQKRGLPHAHILVILQSDDVIRSADNIDASVSAEFPPIPSRDTFPGGAAGTAEYNAAMAGCIWLTDFICSNLTHRVCGIHGDRKATCLDKHGDCKSGFPKDYANKTTWLATDTYPKYCRRSPADGGRQQLHTDSKGKVRMVDNRWIVAHNRAMTMKFRCHINVEASERERAASRGYTAIGTHQFVQNTTYDTCIHA